MKPGDVFAIRLPQGRYGAMRVIKQHGKSNLVYTSTYLAEHLPNLDSLELLEILNQQRFFFKGEPAIRWLEGQPPKSALHIGNIPLSEQESKIVCAVYGGKWDESSGVEVFWEWRWKYDREAFEEEIKQKEREQKQLGKPQQPKRMMAEKTFWQIIRLVDWKFEGEDDKVIAPTIQALTQMSPQSILGFAERLAFQLYKLDTKKHATNAGIYVYHEKDNYISADGFLYARCAVVANGRSFYEEVLKDPLMMPKNIEFEALLRIAPTAYEVKTGMDFEYTTGCSFETFSNTEGWQ